MDNPNPIYYRDLITPDDSITKLISQLQELVSQYDSAKSKIQGAAAEVAKGLQGVSGATEEQRKQVQLATEQSEKLVAQYRDVTSAQWKATQAFTEAAAAKKESSQVDKLITQINTSAEGSYNRLSAQYRLNKLRLNEMSAAERQGTEAGRALEKETAAIYEEMKRLQEATGKHQLNVGNYAEAAKGMKMELKDLTMQMAAMKMAGEDNSQEYRQMAARAGELKDAMQDASEEVNTTANDTQALNSVMAGLAVGGGALAALTKGFGLFGKESEDAQDAQKGLGVAMAGLAGLVTIQTNLQKQSNLMVGIGTIQNKALAASENLKAKATAKSTVATGAATVAQRIFNAVAAANPYVLLAVALITVVGALIAFSVGSNRAAKDQQKLNKQLAAQLDYMEQLAESSTRANNERIQVLQNELDVAKARNASVSETRRIEDEIYKERVAAHDKQMEIYWAQVDGLEANRAKMEELQKTLLRLKEAQAQGIGRVYVDVDMDGKIEKTKVDKAIEAVQGQIDNLGRSVQVAVDLRTEGADIAKERAVQLAQRRNEARQFAKAETDALRAAQDARLALIKDNYRREQQQLKANSNRQIEDIRTRIKTETNLTKKAREAMQKQIKAIETKYYRDLQALQDKYRALNIAAVRETEDTEIALMAEGAEKQRRELQVSYARRINDLQTALKTETGLTETQRGQMLKQIDLLGEQYAKELDKLNADILIKQKKAASDSIQLQLDAAKEGSQEEIDLQLKLMENERDIELEENRKLAEDVKQDEALIRAKWAAKIAKQETESVKARALMLLEQEQELAESEFTLLDRNERQKTIFQLKMEADRLRKLLELDKTAAVRMTEEQRKAMENTLKAIEKEASKVPYNNIYELLGIGLDSDQQDALNTAVDSVKESISGIVESWNSVADAAVTAADAQVEASKKALDAEIEARNAGYANEVETAQKELAAAKAQQAEALKEKEKAQKAELALDTVTQASSLITASANIWKALSGIPMVGPGLAVANIALMWGSFAAAKLKAIQATQTEQYGEGTIELLQGGSHASGNDIDLGRKPNGTRRRAEGGEFFAIINKRNSKRYRNVIPDVINSLNNGTFAERYQRASAQMSGLAVGMMGGTDVTGLERDVAAIRRQGDESRYVDGAGNTVIKYRNLTRKIYNN